MFIEVGNQTVPGILSGCVGAGRQNSVISHAISYNSKSGENPTYQWKNVEMVIES